MTAADLSFHFLRFGALVVVATAFLFVAGAFAFIPGEHRASATPSDTQRIEALSRQREALVADLASAART